MSDDALRHKFATLASRYGDELDVARLGDALWKIDAADDVAAVMSLARANW